MIATIGLPGGAHHRWTRVKTRKEAAIWLEKAQDRLEARNRAAHPQPTCVLTEKEAARVRWQDGSKVYPRRVPGNGIRSFPAFHQALADRLGASADIMDRIVVVLP